VLQLKLAELGFAANFKLVEQLRRAPGLRISVWPGLFVSRTGTGALVLDRKPEREFNAEELSVDLSCRTRDVVFAGRKFIWQIQPQKRFQPPQKKAADATPALRELFDAGKIGGKILLRHWRAGDRFQPIGLKSAVKLQDLFTNAKIPRERRRNLVVAEAAGGIFWVEGLRIGERFKLTAKTKRKLVWRGQKSAV
jgi:tRNA(Ile)-lysidine synthase